MAAIGVLEFEQHFRYQPEKDGGGWCHAGGRGGGHENYGWNHVIDPGCDNCLFCGKRFEVAKTIICMTCKSHYEAGGQCLCDKERTQGTGEAQIRRQPSCVCGHREATDHYEDGERHEARPCLVHGCTCTNYVAHSDAHLGATAE